MKKNDRNSTGYHIYKSLTEKQLISLLDEIFSQLDEKKIGKILGNLDNDISATLTSIFSLKDSTEEGSVISIASDEKCIEEWNSLWEEWERIASQVGDDKGIYVNDDDDSDEVIFDGDKLMEDLEIIGKRMLPLIQKIYRLNISENNIFLKKMGEIDNAIKDYSGWVRTDFDYFEWNTGYDLTSALLEWEWLEVKAKKLSVEEYLRYFIELESKFYNFPLNSAAYDNFFVFMAEENAKEIYEHIKEHINEEPWTGKFSMATFILNEIYPELAGKFSREDSP